ncbi:MAG: peptidase M48 [Sulfurimonas sp. RIFOXYD12_FULL_33_39]|uniref:M48 family metallopeptidase n=1 Tax=unclassified Sulfurimonas TaxID=2623549 RepID=UPI0008BB936B|nr:MULTISPECIES: M48 family metallopeptidase [unclassified Sulfurimonas]OHE01556.1 MAG: peptidase M48 [Sulfurimonas sp. RIFCSPLOWO2_12_FULL_34_6]OHE10013.1 MAG: peptidase M48 [Sulfurimonas sp. RIFOXYD12_FULL_33_39]OHE14767.1 MAG: peptidase M48 [Sulfurimonas sp. RIFOXYD2_FULL_34_21]
MLTTIIAIYTIFVLITIYTSVMQIGYVNQAKRGKAVLLSDNDFIKAGNYSVAKEKMSIATTFIDYVMFIFWIGTGVKFLQDNIFFENEAFLNIAVVMGFLIINSVVSLPFSYYEKFVLDEKFGFNKSTKAQWIKDTFISFAMTLIFGSLVVWGIYMIISSLTLWWLWSFIFIFCVIVLINMLYPTFRAMFFDKLTPLQNEELDNEIKNLMDKTGFVSSGVFVSDASKRDARLNAYFGGFGKTKRVVLFDTLIEKLTTKELLAVLGHELGHFAHGDIYKNIALMGGMLFAMFGIFGNLPDSLYMELGVDKSPYAVMILLLLLMPVLGFLMMPIMGAVSRHNEYEADKTGSELGGSGGAVELANALKKLVNENKSFPLSHPLYIFFHYTHPPVLERLKELGIDIDDSSKSALGASCQADI